MRIGIDVGGTNTDAVLMDGMRVLGWAKSPTTPDVTGGILNSLRALAEQTRFEPAEVRSVMIGTTHFTNAVVERRRLRPTAVVRLGLPATESLPPMVDWPAGLREAIQGHSAFAHGGREFDGRPISPVDEQELRAIAGRIRDAGIRAIAVSAVFSPVNPEDEDQAAAILAEEYPEAEITISHTIGRIGLLERENAAILNACLGDLAKQVVNAFRNALDTMSIRAPFYISQNDGTLMSAEMAMAYPVLTFASGPTNSIRGAAFLTGIKDGIVVDIGGTTTDVGVLVRGFPREASLAVSVGGVRTNFRMPDVLSIGLGGGSLVRFDPLQVGPQSVGYELTTRALCFGGDTLTATDIAVAADGLDIGDRSRVTGLERGKVEATMDRIHRMVEDAIDRMKTSAAPVPVILVGGGSVLIRRPLAGASEMVQAEHYPVANAIGAAIAQVGGEVDRVFALATMGREEALNQARNEATEKAVGAGADADTVQIVEVEEIPLAYLPGNATRIRVKAVGDLHV